MIPHCDVWKSDPYILKVYNCVYIRVSRRSFTEGSQLSFIYQGSNSLWRHCVNAEVQNYV